MKSDFNHLESLYWVFTQVCNDQCNHCYNLSGPKGDKITEEDCLAIINNLPERIDRIILSGGEPLAEKSKLFLILDHLREKYGATQTQIMLQTNGDLLNEDSLDILIEKGVTRFDIASIDRFHKFKGERLDILSKLFHSRGVSGDQKDPLIEKENYLHQKNLSWGFWGATEDMWLGGNWARGRALQTNLWKKDATHNFCEILSGARNFLGGYDDIPQEVSIQLWKINPCCPGTLYPLGDARIQKVSEVLTRSSKSEIMQALNQGKPLLMGTHLGINLKNATQKAENLENICLYCDAFFREHLEELNQESFIPLPLL
jgi:organic radical activating enzyme